MMTMQEALSAADDGHTRRRAAVTVPLPGLDGPMDPGAVWLVTGPRYVGLTTLALTTARFCAHQGHPTLLALGRDPVSRVVEMLLSAESTVSRTALRLHAEEGGPLEPQEHERLAAARERLAGLPLTLMDPGWLRRADRGALLSAFWDSPGPHPRVVVVDDAQLWNAQLGAEVPERLQDLAARWGATVLVLHSTRDPRPAHSVEAAREWAPWSEVTDVTVVLDRPEQHDRQSPYVGELHVRTSSTENPVVDWTLAFQGHYARVLALSAGVCTCGHRPLSLHP